MSPHRPSTSQRGFTMVEVLVAIALCSIAMIGIVALHRTQTGAGSVSRRTTEASTLAEDKLESLRANTSATALTSGTETGLDERGQIVTGGLFTRAWTVVNNGSYADLTVTVSWNEDGARSVVVRGRRSL